MLSFKFLWLLGLGLALPHSVSAQSAEAERPWYRISAQAELGALAVLSHKVQFGEGGTYFNTSGTVAKTTCFLSRA
jgi:hypothetical protein